MKKDYTHICIVLDASGSMSSIESDIKGSFNMFLDKQREEPGKTVFDLFQFSSEVERLVKSADLALFKDDLMAKYTCSGMTALNDAVCIAIDTMGKEFAAMPESERPENVLCVIITDGQENAAKNSAPQMSKNALNTSRMFTSGNSFSSPPIRMRLKPVQRWEYKKISAKALSLIHAVLPVCALMWLPSQALSEIEKNDKGKFHDDRQ